MAAREMVLAIAALAAWANAAACIAEALHLRACLRAAVAERDLPAYAPPVTVFVPCRGAGASFEEDVAALLEQDYPHYEVVFVTGSEGEPAYARLADLLPRYPGRARLTVAGPAEGRSQKVHNQLHALSLADERSEVYAFVDNDCRVHRQFLRHLVGPLADERVAASTGYRWYAPARRGAIDLMAANWGAVVAAAQADPRFGQLWGGAMAIRRDRFVALGVARAWAGASTDDDALTRLIRRARLRIAFAPQCYALSTAPKPLGAFMAWGARQLLLMRVYLPELWWPALAMVAASAVAPTAGVLLTLAGALLAPHLLGWALLVLVAGAVPTLCCAAIGHSVERLMTALGTPFARLRRTDYLACAYGSWLFLGHYVMSALTRRVVWQGTTYDLLGPERTVVHGPAQVPERAGEPPRTAQ
jgi:ceramide glucosyltransferase